MATIAPFDPVSLTSVTNGGVTTISRAFVLNQGNAQRLAARRIEELFTGRVNDARAQLADPTSAATQELLLQKSLLIGRKSRISEALSVLGKAQDQFVYLKNHIDYLQDRVTALEAGGVTAGQLAEDFDNKLRKINNLVDAAALSYTDGGRYFSKNLVDTTSRLTYGTQTYLAPYNSATDTYRIDGVFLGTDYFITEDGSGDLFLSDTGYLSSEDAAGTLTEYADYPGTTTGNSSSVEDIALDSFDADTGAIQFTSAGTGTVTGTLTRGGLGLLDAFLYENFATADGIARVKQDLQAAESLVLNTEAGFRAASTTLRTRAALFETQILGIDRDIASEIGNIADENEAKLLAVEIQFSIAQFDFALLASRGNLMVQALLLSEDGSTANDTAVFSSAITGALISVTA
jgi:hypothetical protein